MRNGVGGGWDRRQGRRENTDIAPFIAPDFHPSSSSGIFFL
jgi:hypothetical protein